MESGRLRWWLCGLLFVATALSFLDRQVLSVLAPEITRQLEMSDVQYAHVTTAFLVSYTVMFLLGGRMVDWLGTRLGLTLSVGLWSLANAAHATLHNATQLGVFRFLLGVGEGGCFPGAVKGVAQWFPRRQRALAMGVAIGGASLGSVAAPPLAYWLAPCVGWRGVFLTTGLIGAAWVAVWWWLSAGMPAESAEVNGAEATSDPSAAPAERPALTALLGRRDVWGLALMRFIFDPVFYFYMFWIPKYLAAERQATPQQIGLLTWIPFLALGVSNALGGWVSDGLIRRGMPALSARKLIMAAAALLTLASSLTGQVQSIGLALAMMALLMLAHGFWITNYVTLIGDRFPQGAVGTVMGFAGAVGGLGGILANFNTGSVVKYFGYGPLWRTSGFLYPLAMVILLLTVRPPRAFSDKRLSVDFGPSHASPHPGPLPEGEGDSGFGLSNSSKYL